MAVTVDKIERALTELFDQNGEKYSVFLWQDVIGETLETQKRFSKLIAWIDMTIEQRELLLDVSAPMNRGEGYTKGKLESYLSAAQDIAVLTHSKLLLRDERTSKEQRENIEYTLGKLFGVHYSEVIGDYV